MATTSEGKVKQKAVTAYYNEFDPYAAQWLRNLIAAGHIAPGIVDERSIEDVTPADLAGFTQCHFFAGVGVWSLALRKAGWPDDRPVWTGSCPCQPFSAAGAGAGFADPRHLWPSFAWLIKQCEPAVVFGEQVASKAVEPWVDLVHADVEAMGYAFGAIPFPSAGVGAPHIRDRLFWVADSVRAGSLPGAYAGVHCVKEGSGAWDGESERPGAVGRVADASRDGRREVESIISGLRSRDDAQGSPGRSPEHGPVESIGMGHTDSESAGRVAGAAHAAQAEHGSINSDGNGSRHAGRVFPAQQSTGPVNGFWRNADWLSCRDGKWRPVEPGTFPLATGAASRVGRLRAYGNAINAEAAHEFIAAYLA